MTRTLRRCAAAAGVSGAVLTVAALVGAQPTPAPIRLDYRAPAGCPDEAAFRSLVQQRAPGVRFASEDEPARAVGVRVEVRGRYEGEILFGERDGARASRHVDADSCPQLADALAFMVALAADPRAGIVSAPVDLGGGDAGADAPTPEDASSPAPEVLPPPMAPAPPASAAHEDHAAPPESPPPGAPGGHDWSLGADVSATSGVSPRALIGVSPFIGWRMLRLEFLRAGTGSLVVPDGHADFTWTIGHLDACPLRLAVGSFTGVLCARAEAGALEVQGASVGGAQGGTHPFLAVGPVARAELRVLGPLFVEVEADALLRITADRFYFLPQVTVYEMPRAGFSGGAGLGVHFP